MTNAERDEINKVIAEAIGKCWHKWQLNDDEMVCRRCQRKILFYGDPYVEISLPPRPDFLTSADDLLRLAGWLLEDNNGGLRYALNYGPQFTHYIIRRDENGLYTLPGKVAEALKEGKG